MHDVDSYDMTFEHARWIAEGKPGSFEEWCQKHEGKEWDLWR